MRWMVRLVLLAALVASAFARQMHDHGAPAPSPDGRFNPWIVSDGANGFYVAYVQRTAAANDVMIQRSVNGVLSAPVRVNDVRGDGAVRNENPPKIAVGPSGEVYVVWANERERWKGNVRFARSTDGGKSFGRAINVNSAANLAPVGRAFETIMVDAKGRIYVAWLDERNKTTESRGAEVWMAQSTDGGRTFLADRRILSDVCECCRVALAADRGGSIYLSYRMVPSAGPMLRDIAVARSDDGGKTFTSAVVHRDGWELNACPIAGATMAIDTLGRVHVVWFTEVNGTPSLMAAVSTDKGRTFAVPQVLDPKQKLAKHAHAVAISDGQVAVAWDDTVDGQPMIRFGIIDGTKPVQILGSPIGASYPVIAVSGHTLEIVGLPATGQEVLRVHKVLP